MPFQEIQSSTFITYEGLLTKYLEGKEMTEGEVFTLLDDLLKINNFLGRYLRLHKWTYVYERDGEVTLALCPILEEGKEL